MKVHSGLVDALLAEDVDTVFGLLGGGIEHFVDELVRRGIRFVSVRHEQAAVGMADGYSRANGRIGVAVLSHGPGVSNAGTTMTVARKSRSRILVITSDIGANERFTPHRFEQELFLRATIEDYVTPRWPAKLHLDVADAITRIRRGDGPVALNVPADVFGLELPEGWRYTPVVDVWAGRRPAPEPGAVADLLALLERAERPVILVGRGAVLSGARPELEELAELTGAAIAHTLLAKDWCAGHSHSVGLAGGFGDPEMQRTLDAADVVVAFGASLTRYTTHWGTLFEKASVARVDLRQDAVTEMTPADLTVWADARTTARALLAALGDGPVRPVWTQGFEPPDHEQLTPSAGEWVGHFGLAPRPHENPETAIDIASLLEELSRLLPAERTVVIDNGNAMGAPAARFPVSDPLDQVYPWLFGSIGGGLAVAVGASIGRPDRPTVAFLGDGSLMLGLSDLDTARRQGARLLVVVTADGGFRSERGSYEARSLEPTLADYDNPDFAAVALALGIAGYHAENDAEVRECMDRMRATDPALSEPALLCVHVDRFQDCPEIDRAFANYRPY